MPMHISTRASDADKHDADINSLVYTKGKLYSAGDDGKIKVWGQDLTLLGQVKAHTTSVFCITASDDTLYSASNDGSVKAWELGTLKEKGTVSKEEGIEFWVVRYDNGVLYAGDDGGNVRIHKNGQYFGSINVCEPVKDMAFHNNLMFSVKDNDVVITDLHLGGDKPQFNLRKTIMGRAPLTVFGDKLMFSNREGKNLMVVETTGHFDHIKEFPNAHPMIINALTTACWDGKSHLFSGGWEKILKKWALNGLDLKEEDNCNLHLVINALVPGEKDQLYAAGGDGHIVCVDM